MKLTESDISKCLAQNFTKIELNVNKLCFQNKPELYALHRLFVSALYYKNQCCLLRLEKLNNMQIYIDHYNRYYERKKELIIMIKSLKFAIRYAKKRAIKPKQYLQE